MKTMIMIFCLMYPFDSNDLTIKQKQKAWQSMVAWRSKTARTKVVHVITETKPQTQTVDFEINGKINVQDIDRLIDKIVHSVNEK